MNIHEFRNALIRVSHAIKTQRTYNALETHMKREFAGQIRGRQCTSQSLSGSHMRSTRELTKIHHQFGE